MCFSFITNSFRQEQSRSLWLNYGLLGKNSLWQGCVLNPRVWPRLKQRSYVSPPTFGSSSTWHPPKMYQVICPLGHPVLNSDLGSLLLLPASTLCHPLAILYFPTFTPTNTSVPDHFLGHGFCPTIYLPSRPPSLWNFHHGPGTQLHLPLASLTLFHTHYSTWVVIPTSKFPPSCNSQLKPCLLHRGCLNYSRPRSMAPGSFVVIISWGSLGAVVPIVLNLCSLQPRPPLPSFRVRSYLPEGLSAIWV